MDCEVLDVVVLGHPECDVGLQWERVEQLQNTALNQQHYAELILDQ